MAASAVIRASSFPTCLRPPKCQAKRRTVPGASHRRETGTHFSGSCSLFLFRRTVPLRLVPSLARTIVFVVIAAFLIDAAAADGKFAGAGGAAHLTRGIPAGALHRRLGPARVGDIRLEFENAQLLLVGLPALHVLRGFSARHG